jgi:tRNA-dihydrouridine synthase
MVEAALAFGRIAIRPVLLSPLEGLSDAGFRRLCFELGAGFTWTEMIRAKAIARENASTLDLIDTFDSDVPTGIQLSATDEKSLQAALAVIDRLSASGRPHFRNIRAVDLNFGCPSQDVISCGAGPAMLKRRSKLRDMFTTLRIWREHTHLDIAAIGAKIRLGLNAGEQKRKVGNAADWRW